MSCFRSAVLLLVVLASPSKGQVPEHERPGHALVGGDDPLVVALVAEALQNNPDLRVAAAMVAEAAARPAQAEALPEPQLSVLYTNEGWAPNLGQNEFTTLGFLWSQELPGRGKRELRGGLLRHDVELARQQLERARLRITGAVRRSYHELIHARELMALQGEEEALYDTVVAASLSRYAVGRGLQADVLRAQAERLRLRLTRAQREADERVLLAGLNQLLGRPHHSAQATATHAALRPIEGDLESMLAQAESVSPELKGARIARERDGQGLRLAERAGQVDWSVQAGYLNRGGLPGMWQAGFGLRLPLWRGKVEAGVAEAQARVSGAEERFASTRLVLRLRTEERLLRARALEEGAVLYAQGLLPQARLAYESALRAYETGQGAFTAVLEALAALFRDREADLRLRADHQILEAGLAEASLESTPTMGAGR